VKKTACCLLLAGLTVLAAGSVSQAVLITYYVSTSGSDSNSGTLSTSAFQNVTTVAQVLAAAPGNDYRVYFKAGNYYYNGVFTLDGLTGSIDLIGDTLGAVFGETGPVQLTHSGSGAAAVNLKNLPGPLTWTGINVAKYPGIPSSELVHVQACGNISFRRASFFPFGIGALTYGLSFNGGSVSSLVDGCVVSGTAYGVYLNGSSHVTVQNSWLYGNTTGISLHNSAHVLIVNNTLVQNSLFGVDIVGSSAASTLFNNIICDNGAGANSGGQIQADTLPVSASSASTGWRSAYNVIGGKSQRFGVLVQNTQTLSLPDQKTWLETTGQDLWGASLNHPVVNFQSDRPVPLDLSWVSGYGVMTFNGYAAPTTDFLGNPRPQALPDFGCLEMNENSSAYFHHLVLLTGAPQALPQQPVAVAVALCNSRGQILASPVLTSLYAYLQGGPGLTQVDPTGQISSADVAVAPDGAVPGLFKLSDLSGSVDTLPPAFNLSVSRAQASSSSQAYTLCVAEWSDWNVAAILNTGGRLGTLAGLRWTATPDSHNSQATAVSPVPASSPSGSQITITLRDAAGNPISGLAAPDFQISFPGPGSLTPLAEDSQRPGVYLTRLISSAVGTQMVRITVLGVLLADQLQIVFTTGVYGTVTDRNSRQPLSGIHLTLTAPDGSAAGASDAVNGTYGITLARVAAGTYALQAQDPSGVYPLASYSLILPSDQSLRQDVALGTAAPDQFAGYAFPNPAPRGATLTLACNLPQAGRLRVDLFDLRGRRIRTVLDKDFPAGYTRIPWPAVNRFGANLAPGVYLLVFTSGSQKSQAKVVITP
jgi:parallel beta-helix repeat protein